MEREVRIRFPGRASTSHILENSRRGNVVSYIYIHIHIYTYKYGFSRNSMLPVAWNRSTGSNDAEDATTWDILASTWNLELLFDVRKRNKLNFRRCFFPPFLSTFSPSPLGDLAEPNRESFIKLSDLLKLRDAIFIPQCGRKRIGRNFIILCNVYDAVQNFFKVNFHSSLVGGEWYFVVILISWSFEGN